MEKTETIPKQLNITDKTYDYEKANPYQKMIFRMMAHKIDQLNEIKKQMNDVAEVDIKNKLNTLLVKQLGVLEFMQARYENFDGLEQVDHDTNLSLYDSETK